MLTCPLSVHLVVPGSPGPSAAAKCCSVLPAADAAAAANQQCPAPQPGGRATGNTLPVHACDIIHKTLEFIHMCVCLSFTLGNACCKSAVKLFQQQCSHHHCKSYGSYFPFVKGRAQQLF